MSMRAGLLIPAVAVALACGAGPATPGAGVDGGASGGGGTDAGAPPASDAGASGGAGNADAGNADAGSGSGGSGSSDGGVGGESGALTYDVKDLGEALVFSVDPRGRVAGATCTGSGSTAPCQGAIFTHSSGWSAVPVPEGASHVDAIGIDAAGNVGLNASFPFQRSSYRRAYTASPLRPVPTASQTPQTTFINAVHPMTGHLVGYDEALGGAYLDDGAIRALAVRPGKTSENAGPSQATALNAHDQVVGWMRPTSDSGPDNDSQRHAFLWERGKLTDLGSGEGPCDRAATGINDSGVVIGWTDGDRCGKPVMFIWDGQLRVAGCPPGTMNCNPTSINGRGNIVGSALVSVLDPQQGFLYRAGAWHRLEDL